MEKTRFKSLCSYVWLVVMLACVASCSDDDELQPQQTDFVTYKIKGYEEAKTTIDAATHTITVRLPDDVTDGSALVPEFTVSDGAQASINRVVQQSGANTLNFNDMVLYTVSNADYTVKTRWHVVVTNNDYTARYGMGNFLSYWWSNNGTSDQG